MTHPSIEESQIDARTCFLVPLCEWNAVCRVKMGVIALWYFNSSQRCLFLHIFATWTVPTLYFKTVLFISGKFSFPSQASVESQQQEHRREPSGGSDNVVCSEEEENDSVDAGASNVNGAARTSLNDDDSFSSATSARTSPPPPAIRGNQIRIEPVPDLLK